MSTLINTVRLCPATIVLILHFLVRLILMVEEGECTSLGRKVWDSNLGQCGAHHPHYHGLMQLLANKTSNGL